MQAKERLIVALDFPTVNEARAMAVRLKGRVGVMKIGMELIYAGGLDLARELIDAGEQVFIDAKLLDIGNTVKRATEVIAASGAAFLTVHATDRKTLMAAREGRGDSRLKLLAVTVMTNLSDLDLAEQGISGFTPRELALHRAALAGECGFDGLVASGHEAAAIRARVGRERLIVTPGIRPAGGARGDQARVMTPALAIKAGADYLVVGRPITEAASPEAAAEAIVAEIAAAR
jgi:orotidine-5'-phosphate decarboxylase